MLRFHGQTKRLYSCYNNNEQNKSSLLIGHTSGLGMHVSVQLGKIKMLLIGHTNGVGGENLGRGILGMT